MKIPIAIISNREIRTEDVAKALSSLGNEYSYAPRLITIPSDAEDASDYVDIIGLSVRYAAILDITYSCNAITGKAIYSEAACVVAEDSFPVSKPIAEIIGKLISAFEEHFYESPRTQNILRMNEYL